MPAQVMVLLALMLVPDRDVVRTDATDGLWRDNATWDIDAQPDKYDRVLIPGERSRSASVVLEQGADTQHAATVMVGREQFSDGALEVHGALRVAGSAVNESEAGRLYVGGADGTGLVMQHPGSDVYVSKSLRIGYYARSTATYVVQNSKLVARRSLILADNALATGELQIVGSQCLVQTNALAVGGGVSTLTFESDTDGFSPIHIVNQAELGGILRIRISQGTQLADEFPLLNLEDSGIVTGGFRQVMIDAPPGVHYELSYTGGTGNDVTLVRQDSALNRFESWTTATFGSSAPFSDYKALGDPDEDELENLGEYKLGCSPVVNEGGVFDHAIDSSGRPYIEFTERTDRADVITTAQTSFDGRIWKAGGLTSEVISVYGNTRTMRVKPDIAVDGLRFRLMFERLPDSNVRPNVVFIMIDDLSDWIEPLGGHPQAITPNLNALAARGVLFTNAQCASPICHGSRTAILTGVAPYRSGVYHNQDRLRNSPLLDSHPTISEQFSSSGYVSVGSGKLFHRAHPEAWSDYYPSLTEQRPEDPVPPSRINGITDRGKNFDWGPLDVLDTEMADHKVATWVCDRIKSEQGASPTFIGCGFFRPHLPFYAPAKWFSKWKTEKLKLPLVAPGDLGDVPLLSYASGTVLDHDAVVAAGQWQQGIHGYLASIRFADAQLGRVMNALDNSDMARNTIVVLTSDHGWQLGTKETWRKSTLWEESTRTPMMIVAPGTTTPGTRCHEFVSLLDIYPTLIDLTGISEPQNLDGQSLLSQLVNPAAPRTEPVLTSRRQFEHSLRTGRWRLSRYEDGSMELYDHAVDPYEWNNIAADPSKAGVIENLEVHFPDDPAPPTGE